MRGAAFSLLIGIATAAGAAEPAVHVARGADAGASGVVVLRGPAITKPQRRVDEDRVVMRDDYATAAPWAGGRIDEDGADYLDPWLSNTREGRYFVTWNFDHDRNGILRRREAARANAAFARFADSDGDGRLSGDEIAEALGRVGG